MLSVKIDTSMVVPLLEYLNDSKKTSILEITKHPAAKMTYSHSRRFSKKRVDIKSFWKKNIKNLSKQKHLIKRVKTSLKYLYEEQDAFNSMIKELWDYFPEGTNLRCRLFAILGYDAGFVSEGNAFINLAHADYDKEQTELLYMSMHYLHNVVYTSYNPLYDMTKMVSVDQFVDMIKYFTHMQGLATYSTFDARKNAGALNNKDYQILMNAQALQKKVTEYFNIVTKLETQPVKTLQEKHWGIIDNLSGKKRLWYLAGAHMAGMIDKHLGRKVLNDTIRHGPDVFFKQYHKTL